MVQVEGLHERGRINAREGTSLQLRKQNPVADSADVHDSLLQKP